MKAIVGVVRWLISVLFLLRRRLGVRHRTCFLAARPAGFRRILPCCSSSSAKQTPPWTS